MTGRKKIKLLTFCLAERFLPFMALLSTYILIFCTFAPDFSHRGARVIRAEIIPIEPDPGNAGEGTRVKTCAVLRVRACGHAFLLIRIGSSEN